jgi:hypothetical protein
LFPRPKFSRTQIGFKIISATRQLNRIAPLWKMEKVLNLMENSPIAMFRTCGIPFTNQNEAEI